MSCWGGQGGREGREAMGAVRFPGIGRTGGWVIASGCMSWASGPRCKGTRVQYADARVVLSVGVGGVGERAQDTGTQARS